MRDKQRGREKNKKRTKSDCRGRRQVVFGSFRPCGKPVSVEEVNEILVLNSHNRDRRNAEWVPRQTESY